MSSAVVWIDSSTKENYWVTQAQPLPVALYTSDGGSANPTTASRIPSSAATTNPTVAKASAGSAFSVNGYNASAGVIYLKFYDKATAPTVGTDTPVLTLALPPTATFDYTLGGFAFSTGIAYGLTTGAADNSSTAVGAADILGLNVAYS